MKARIIVVVATLTLALGVGLGTSSSAQALGITPLPTIKSPGQWIGSGGGALGGALYDFTCKGTSFMNSARVISLQPQKVGRSPANNLTQEVWMQAYVEFSYDGTTWYKAFDAGWQKRTLNYYNTVATFDQADFNVTNYVNVANSYGRQLLWRVRAGFHWYTAPTTAPNLLGSRVVGYTVANTYGAIAGQGKLYSTGEFVCIFS